MSDFPNSRPSRRAVLCGLAGAGVAAAAPANGRAAAARPNILWIVSEDNNPYIGAYGDPVARTPNIDGLAKKGLVFRNAFSNAPVCAPSRFAILTGLYPESCAPANQMRAKASLPSPFKTYPELLRASGYFCTNNSKTDYNCDVDPAKIWDMQGADAHWRERSDSTPFMAVFNYETTHESRIFRPTSGRVTPEMVSLPPFLPNTPAIRQDYASYYNLMERFDDQLAARLAELEADGLADDTIVFYYSDNGGVLGRSKRYCFEEGLRCVLIIYVPPKWRHLMPSAPGSEVESPVSLIDLAPTVLALAQIPRPAQMRGRALLGHTGAPPRYAFAMRNRMDERIDFQRTVTDGRWRYIRNYMPHRPWGQHQAFEWLAKGYQDWEAAHRAGTLNAIQDRFFKAKPFEELYDLVRDPHEIDSRVGDPSAATKLAELRRALDKHMVSIHDNGFLPETMEGEGYIASRDPRIYPLRKIMVLAGTAARGIVTDVPDLADEMSNRLAVMRYWAATGLLIRGSDARSALPQLVGAMRNDPSPFVRIVAAEAVAMQGLGDEAAHVLAAIVDTAPVWQQQLHALNALTHIGGAAHAAADAVARAALSEQEYVRNAGRYLSAVLDGSYTPALPIFDLARMMSKGDKGQ